MNEEKFKLLIEETNWELLDNKERFSKCDEMLTYIFNVEIISNITSLKLTGSINEKTLTNTLETLDCIGILVSALKINYDEDLYAKKYILANRIDTYKQLIDKLVN